jgi:hypothetical protein
MIRLHEPAIAMKRAALRLGVHLRGAPARAYVACKQQA